MATSAADLAVAARMLRESEQTPVWIYFVQSGEHGPVKIGVAKDPRERLATLQQGNPVRLRLIAVYRGLALEEKQIHGELASARITGEWFEATDEVLELSRLLNDHLALEDFAEAPA